MVKFLANGLEMLKTKCSILNFLWLILWILLKLTPSAINKNFKISKTFLKTHFELILRKQSYFALVLLIVLVPTSTN